MRRSEHDRSFIVATHSHAPAIEAIVPRKLVEEREEWCRLNVEWRYAHQPGKGYFGSTRLLEQIGQILHWTAALLRLFADVDLDKARNLPTLLVERPCKRSDEAWPVERMDQVEQPHGILCLVRLKLADQVERNVGIGFAQGGPLALRLLHAVLAEMPLTFAQERLDHFGRMRLADRDQRYLARFAPRDLACLRDVSAHLLQRGLCLFHGEAL
jgi:hypothetical protein